MKYESEILYDLMKRDGLLNPSQDHLPYESELKEKYVYEVEGAYPKLIDYQAEWLNYAYNNPIGEFPYVTLSDVTNATIENVVPYAYRSAILKGDTKFIDEYGVEHPSKSIFHSSYFEQGTIGGTIGSTISKEDSTTRIRTINPLSLEIGSYSITVITGYEVYVKIINSTNNIGIRQGGFDSFISFNITDSSNEKVYIVFRKSDSGNITTDEVEGIVSSSTIPELDSLSLVSVKMPVLTTTGKNLYDFKLEGGNHGGGSNNIRCKTVEVEELTTYTISNNMGYIINIYFNDKNNNEIGNAAGTSDQLTNTFTTPQGTKYMWFRTWSNMNDINVKIQMEKGTRATRYEPYKTNILTVNEDVTLRGIGDVKDELNLLTGEVVQSVGVLNGEEVGWKREGNSQAPTDSSLIAFSIDLIKSPNKNLLSSVLEKSSDVNKPYRWYVQFGSWLVITLPKSEVANLDEFKAWLKNNEVLYPLTEKSIKTVDLTILDQNGSRLSQIKPIEGTMNLITSSDTIPPLFNGEIPVEAIEQNLASFVKE